MQEPEGAGRIASTIRKQRKSNAALQPLFFLFSLGPSPLDAITTNYGGSSYSTSSTCDVIRGLSLD